MQSVPLKENMEKLQIAAKSQSSDAHYGADDRQSRVSGYNRRRSASGPSALSTRPPQRGGSIHRTSMSIRRSQVEAVAMGAGKSRRGYAANKEVIRRALTPPIRRPTLRWWNFRPTPSRLSSMSMA